MAYRYPAAVAIVILLLLFAGCTDIREPGEQTRKNTTPNSTKAVRTTAIRTTTPAVTASAVPETPANGTLPVPNVTLVPTNIPGYYEVPGRVIIDLRVENFAFNRSTIIVPAGSEVTIRFDNEDSGAAHNFALYDTPSKGTTIFKGKLLAGVARTEYSFTAPAVPGTYHFQSDRHSSQMYGQFIVK